MNTSKDNLRDFQPSLGMFNMFKGMGIIGVIIFHTTSSFSFSGVSADANIVTKALMLLFFICASGLMPAFFIASGYGFRPQKAAVVKKKAGRILLPYSIMVIVTVMLHFAFHYGAFHYLKGSIKESIKVFIGFILALSSNMEIGGTVFYSCGIGWYLISLLGVIVLLNVLLSVGKDKAWILVLICALVGCLLGKYRIFIFCISQILTGVFFFYEGYIIKKHKLLYRRWNIKWSLVFVLCIAVMTAGVIYSGQVDNIAEGIWNLSIISVIVDGTLAFLCLYIILLFNQVDNWFLSLLKKLGSKSLIIFCIHSIEMKSIPWYIFFDKWTGNPITGCAILVLARMLVIFVAYRIFIFVNKNIWRKVVHR